MLKGFWVFHIIISSGWRKTSQSPTERLGMAEELSKIHIFYISVFWAYILSLTQKNPCLLLIQTTMTRLQSQHKGGCFCKVPSYKKHGNEMEASKEEWVNSQNYWGKNYPSTSIFFGVLQMADETVNDGRSGIPTDHVSHRKFHYMIYKSIIVKSVLLGSYRCWC